MAEESAPLNVAQLVADHHQALYRYAYRLTGSVPDAEDLTQQVFLSAHQSLNQVRRVETGRGWLFAILRNAFLKNRRQRVAVPMSSIDYDLNSIPDEVAPQQIDSERLQAVLNRLPDEFKIVVLMFY